MSFKKVTGAISQFMYSFCGAQRRRPCGVIITAAGSGSRMGNVAKQLMEIAGNPVIAYSIKAFEDSVNTDEIVIVAREEDIPAMNEIVRQYAFQKVKAVVAGGSTRDESVRNGFCALSDKMKFVAVHDAARPLITTDKLDEVFRDAFKYGAACAVGKIHDTVKQADEKGFIQKTVPRDALYAAQTPQIFMCDIYRTAIALQEKNKAAVTDDCSMVENAGFKIKLCDINIPNHKLTVPHDVEIIEAILMNRRKKNCPAQ